MGLQSQRRAVCGAVPRHLKFAGPRNRASVHKGQAALWLLGAQLAPRCPSTRASSVLQLYARRTARRLAPAWLCCGRPFRPLSPPVVASGTSSSMHAAVAAACRACTCIHIPIPFHSVPCKNSLRFGDGFGIPANPPQPSRSASPPTLCQGTTCWPKSLPAWSRVVAHFSRQPASAPSSHAHRHMCSWTHLYIKNFGVP